MSQRIVVDPVTRIEGHLRIEAQTDDSGAIVDAYSSGTMVRGIEIILRGRDPRDAWAFAQRICGVCTLVHGIASVRAVENALGYEIPPNAQLIRNLMIAAQHVHDHVMHFYHLHALDWVDLVSALRADPAATSALARSLSGYEKSTPAYFSDVRTRLQGLVESGQLGIFANGYWAHPEYRLPPELNLLVLAHYLEALGWQRDVARLHAVFGGKNPHPNLVVGGSPSPFSAAPDGPGPRGGTALDAAGLAVVRGAIGAMQTFVRDVYVPDVLAISSHYKDWFGRGEGGGNFLTVGDFPAPGREDDPSSFFIPSGVIQGRRLDRIEPLDLGDPAQVQEFVTHSWYEYTRGKTAGLHPYEGQTQLAYTGPRPPYEQLEVEREYSWIKSPRWRGKAVEVGPLARVLMLHAHGHAPTRTLCAQALAQLELPFEALYSTLGRTLARALETQLFADQMPSWLDALEANAAAGELAVHNTRLWEPRSWPPRARGVGFMEAPRGALAHWVVIENQKIANYQAVVPTTWNAGPRDASGVLGPYEAALRDRHALHDPEQPLEILRTLHSFDPCVACAVHVSGPRAAAGLQVRVR